MTTTKSVKISPEFFSKEIREYANWRWAFVREALQNCIDAPHCKNINFLAVETDDETIVIWSNDGKPMDMDTIENKLFALGGTGKGFDNTIGGFGKAKTLLYFAHSSYEIKTGNLLVQGCGGDYTITETSDKFYGTSSAVRIPGHFADDLNEKAERFVNLAQWAGNITIRGGSQRPDLRKGSLRRELSFGNVYTNKSYENLLIVRIGGIPMFTKHTRLNRCVIVELTGSSAERLTSNRDSLLSKYSIELDEFLVELAVDRKSALSNRRQIREFFGQELIGCGIENQLTSVDSSKNEELATDRTLVSNFSLADSTQAVSDKSSHVSPNEQLNLSKSEGPFGIHSQSHRREMRFVVHNKTDRKIPKWLLPGANMRTYARRLAKTWANILVELHKITGKPGLFSIGFVFDEDPENRSLAMFERHDGESIYYINPTKPGFKKRFSAQDKDLLIAFAAHEFVHGCYQRTYHDEDFSTDLTLLMAEVTKHRKRFNKCFRDDTFSRKAEWS